MSAKHPVIAVTGSSGAEIVGNIFQNMKRAVQLGGGRDHRVENNQFIDCETGIDVDGRGVDNSPIWQAGQKIMRDQWNALPADTRKDLEDYFFCTKEIFPGGLNPRLDELIQAVNPYFEVMQVNTRRNDYKRTTAEWQRRLRLNEKTVRQKWGDKVFEDYDRYLGTCVRAFDIHYSSLAQFELKRIG